MVSSVDIVTCYGPGDPVFGFRYGHEMCLGLNQLFIQSEPESLFAGMKRLRPAVDLPPSYIGEV